MNRAINAIVLILIPPAAALMCIIVTGSAIAALIAAVIAGGIAVPVYRWATRYPPPGPPKGDHFPYQGH